MGGVFQGNPKAMTESAAGGCIPGGEVLDSGSADFANERDLIRRLGEVRWPWSR